MPASSSFFVSFAWGLAVLASFVGWGRLARRQLAPAQDVGWGLEAAWGMAVVLVLCGPLMLAGLATRALLLVLVSLGLLVFLCGIRRPAARDAASFGTAVVLIYVPYVQTGLFNPQDDFLAYIPFAREILETGSLGQPFSLRRLGAHGGQSVLQALTMCFGSARAAGMLDFSLGPLILAGMAWRMGGPWLAVLTALLPQFHQNTASQTTGALMFLAMYRTLTLDAQHSRKLVLAALTAAGAATLRNHYLVSALLLYPLCTRQWKLRPVLFGTLAAALAVPWMAGSYRAVGAWLYPLQRGFQHEAFSMTDPFVPAAWALWAAGFFAAPMVLAFLIPPVIASFRRAEAALRGLLICALITCIILLATITRSEPLVMTRYAYALLLPCWIAAMARLLESRRLQAALVLSALSWALLTWDLRELAFKSVLNAVRIGPAITESLPLIPPDRLSAYAAIDAALPPGEKVYAALPEPYALSFRDGRILLADLPGLVSPGAAMPIGQGPAPLRDYLLRLGVRYIAFGDFDRDLGMTEYSRPHWQSLCNSPIAILKVRAPLYLDVMENLSQLKRDGRVLVDQAGLCLFALR